MKFLIALVLPLAAMPAVWPEDFGGAKRVSAAPVAAAGPLWAEYGFKDGETAAYEAAGTRFTATAWRLQDSTAAMAAFEWQRPADARPSEAATLAASTKDGLVLAYGNYLVAIQGYKPPAAEMKAVLDRLPHVEQTPLPNDYLPTRDFVANSERYILGPHSLAQFEPGIPPAVAGFHFGAEAQLAAFHTPKGDLKLAIFNYPTPQIAIQQYEAFNKLPGAMAKRSGPLIAVVLSPADPNAAEHLLSQVRYQAEITLNERVPTHKDNIGNLVVTAFELTGILLAFTLVSGLAYGGLRAFLRRGAKGRDAEAMIVLHLQDR